MSTELSNVKVIDATLREGCQSPGVQFTDGQTVEIARCLDLLGVDQIECGHPAISLAELDRVRKVVGLRLSTPILAHARAHIDDIDAVSLSGASWVGIFLGINDVTREAKLGGCSVGQVIEKITKSIKHARQKELLVRYTLEDASRTDEELMRIAFTAAVDSGANRICFADTVGIAEPSFIFAQVTILKRLFPHVDIELHLHNDRGLSMANALAGIDAGAKWISTSVNGIGERSGITDLCLLLANLHHRGLASHLSGRGLQDISARVAAYTRSHIDSHHPITGRNAFTHTARLHVSAIKRDEIAYNWLQPLLIGRRTAINPPHLPANSEDLYITPKLIPATELRYHREGVGTRYVMMDERLVPDCRQYCIVREIPFMETAPPSHVDVHIHKVDSLFMFLGNQPGLKGLRVEVRVDGFTKEIESPVSVFIPAGISHTYRILKGSGIFVNHVLCGSYNDSLLESDFDAYASK